MANAGGMNQGRRTPGHRGSRAGTRPGQRLKIADAAKFYLHRDHLSSVRLVTDAAGAIVESTGYAAYGKQTNSGFQTQKGFIGERDDPGEADKPSIR